MPQLALAILTTNKWFFVGRAAARFKCAEASVRDDTRKKNMADTNTLVHQLSGLTVLQVAELVKALEEKWGVSAAAPVAVAAAGGAAAGGGAVFFFKQKTAYEVILTETGGNKIAVIKEVRASVAGLGL